MKKMLTILICVCLLLTGVPAVNVHAAQNAPAAPEVQPYFQHIAHANVSFNISKNGTADISCMLYAYANSTSKVTIRADLQQYRSGRWYTVRSYSAEKPQHVVELHQSVRVAKGYDYRVRATFTAYSGATSEKTVQNSNIVSYK